MKGAAVEFVNRRYCITGFEVSGKADQSRFLLSIDLTNAALSNTSCCWAGGQFYQNICSLQMRAAVGKAVSFMNKTFDKLVHLTFQNGCDGLVNEMHKNNLIGCQSAGYSPA